MQKPLSGIATLAAVILLAGCAGPPQPVIHEVPQKQADPFGGMTGRIMESGGLAAIGVGKSKSLELARNRAIVNSRLNLQKMLDTRLERLQRKFTEESGIAQGAQQLEGFRTAAQAVKKQIQKSAPGKLKHETIDGTVTAYALMELNPETILKQLQKNDGFFSRLRATKTFESLEKEIQEYEAYKKARTDALLEQ